MRAQLLQLLVLAAASATLVRAGGICVHGFDVFACRRADPPGQTPRTLCAACKAATEGVCEPLGEPLGDGAKQKEAAAILMGQFCAGKSLDPEVKSGEVVVPDDFPVCSYCPQLLDRDPPTLEVDSKAVEACVQNLLLVCPQFIPEFEH
jgi:hypothetical protein